MSDESATPPGELDSVAKAAVLLLSLGEQHASLVLRHLEAREVQRVGTAMAALSSVNNAQVSEVLENFLQSVSDHSGLAIGATSYLKRILVKSQGQEKGEVLVERILGGNTSGLDKLKWLDARGIADFIVHEHPQIQAIILSYLEPKQASEVLSLFRNSEEQLDVVMRIANLESIPPNALAELNEVLEQQVSERPSGRLTHLGGAKMAADIMNNMDSGSGEDLMTGIKESDEVLSNQIQELMFIFDNLNDVDDRGIQTLLREVSTESLVLALKGADEPIREKIYGNMSKRAAELLQDDMEAKGPVRLSEVEEAQKEILTVARKLADNGDIMLGGAGGEEML